MTGMHNIDFTLGALLKMHSLLSDPNRWHRGDIRGEGPDGKTSWCIVGAYREVTVGDDRWSHRSVEVDEGLEWLGRLVLDGNYENFNDFVTGHSTIMQFLDCAIDQRLRELDYCVEIEHDDITGQIVFPWMRSISSMPTLREASLEELIVVYKGISVAA